MSALPPSPPTPLPQGERGGREEVPLSQGERGDQSKPRSPRGRGVGVRGKGVWRRLLLALALLGVIGAAAYPAARHIRATYHLHRAEQALAADELDEAGVHL